MLVALRPKQISPSPSLRLRSGHAFSKRGTENRSWQTCEFFSLVPIFITSPFEKGGIKGDFAAAEGHMDDDGEEYRSSEQATSNGGKLNPIHRPQH
jgi:hypothetical protein